uniref:Putative rhoa gtpase effector dia/diaphanous n=1 Tax=Anopheles darlingi TaxID=43151 RepID=A0A2M4CXX7_ANODA
MEKYGRAGGDGGDGGDEGIKIPSLMDTMGGGHGGNSRHQQQQQQHHHHRKRWCDEPNRRTPDDEEDRMRHHEAADGGPLGLQHLAGVITRDQINDLEQMGIRTLDEISQLTVAQLNDLGLSITQIHDLQVKALSMKRSRDRPGPEDRLRGAERSSVDRSSNASAKDLDMRLKPGMSFPSGPALNEPIGAQQQQRDVDMRVFPPNGQLQKDETGSDPSLLPSTLLPLKPPTVDYSQYIKDSNLDEEDLDAVAAANPAVLINPDDEDDDDDDDDDENNLKINIEEEEDEQKKDQEEEDGEGGSKSGDQEKSASTPLLPPLVPPKIDYAQGLGDLLLYGSLDKTVSSKPSSVASPRTDEHLSPSDTTASKGTEKDENGSSKLDLLNSDEIWTPSMSLLSSSSGSVAPVIGASEAKLKPASAAGSKRRTTGPPSIYDWDDSDNVASPDGASSPVATPFRYGSSDRALPLNINDDEDEDEAAGARTRDLGLPFKPIMANYVPATEIDGSIGSHATIIYKVYVVEVPKPNFKSLRRSMQRPMGTRDPRLRRLFGLHSDEEDAKDSHDDGDTSEGIKSPDASSIASPPYGVPSLLPASATGVTAPPLTSPQAAASSPSSATRRVDPRKRHAEKLAAAQQQDSSGFGPGGLPPPPSSSGPNATPQLDVQTILQRSPWYKDLGTKHKIMVNQQLAILSTEMKKYHNSDRSTEQLSEFMKFLGTNSMLQHILTCLNVYVDHKVAFCEVAAVPMLQPPPNFPLLANIPPPIVGGGPGAAGAGGGPPGGMPPHLSVPVHIPPPVHNVQQPPPMGLPPLGGNPLTSGPPPPFLNHSNNNNNNNGGNGGPGGRGGDNGPSGGSRFGPPLSQHDGGPPGPGSMGPLPPGLLGIAPNMPFEQFLAMGNINKGGGGGDHGGGPGGGNIPPWTQGNGNNHMRNSNNMRNNNRIGHNFRNNNDRWMNNGGGGGGGNNGGGGGGGNGNNRRNNRRNDRKK